MNQTQTMLYFIRFTEEYNTIFAHVNFHIDKAFIFDFFNFFCFLQFRNDLIQTGINLCFINFETKTVKKFVSFFDFVYLGNIPVGNSNGRLVS